MKKTRSTSIPPLTTHALTRAQQRGIRKNAIQFALDFGQWFYAGQGCMAAYLSRKAVRTAEELWGVRLDPFKNIAVILSEENAIVTVCHTTRPLKHWRGER